ncbi:hypothetical protein CISG_00723 [Coccidioides immitis RMSCC 3703]|uniref:Uncharacterized protein n=2 Tax=Coccidioides immitis TaxID=5501 RepID=A0A0J8QU53_COCIT|nr:hypothetical protein CIRG_03507 [Coccidioides immitis RMSCC 2394]KMU74793.1 hypothetical protein CISG_00723 [Coccidioides immitis RMSCC 3703]
MFALKIGKKFGCWQTPLRYSSRKWAPATQAIFGYQVWLVQIIVAEKTSYTKQEGGGRRDIEARRKHCELSMIARRIKSNFWLISYANFPFNLKPPHAFAGKFCLPIPIRPKTHSTQRIAPI